MIHVPVAQRKITLGSRRNGCLRFSFSTFVSFLDHPWRISRASGSFLYEIIWSDFDEGQLLQEYDSSGFEVGVMCLGEARD